MCGCPLVLLGSAECYEMTNDCLKCTRDEIGEDEWTVEWSRQAGDGLSHHLSVTPVHITKINNRRNKNACRRASRFVSS